MSFQDEYQKQIEQIKPDGYIKGRVRAKLREGERPADGKPRARLLRNAVALALCAVLIFTVGFAVGTRRAKRTALSFTAVNTAASYGEVYDAIKAFVPTVWDRARNFLPGIAYKSSTAENTDIAIAYPQSENGVVATGVDEAETAAADHSETTKQVEGVDEADVVKTDGKYLYSLCTTKEQGNGVRIIDVRGATPEKIGMIPLDNTYGAGDTELYVSGDRLILLHTAYPNRENSRLFGVAEDGIGGSAACRIEVYDLSDRKNPKELIRNEQSGAYTDSRLIDGALYVVSCYNVDVNGVSKGDHATYVPSVQCGKESAAVPAESICVYDHCEMPQYTVVCGYQIEDGTLFDTKSVLGGSFTVYCNTDNLVTAGYSYGGGSGDKTQIVRFSIGDGAITLRASGEIEGTLLNQFSMDEYKGYFRFVTTAYRETVSGGAVSGETVNSLVVLDGGFKQVGAITGIAPGERVYSVRFMGDMAYFVTFRQVDPLFSVDVSDPAAPKIIGSLKIPGFSDFLFPFGGGRLLGIGRNADEATGRTDKMKLSFFDISDPAKVTESHKTDVDAYYSDALYNHKACLVDANQNLIGFPAYHEEGLRYFLYSVENDTFVRRAVIPVDQDEWDARGLYVGKIFYIVTPNRLLYCHFGHYDEMKEITL